MRCLYLLEVFLNSTNAVLGSANSLCHHKLGQVKQVTLFFCCIDRGIIINGLDMAGHSQRMLAKAQIVAYSAS